jgi:hypothetical protein
VVTYDHWWLVLDIDGKITIGYWWCLMPPPPTCGGLKAAHFSFVPGLQPTSFEKKELLTISPLSFFGFVTQNAPNTKTMTIYFIQFA